MTSGAVDPRVVETHSGVVFFFGDRAYKVKKPVDLGFLDFRTLQARHAVCHREVELNRRLSPDVYLGVSDLCDPGGEVCEHLVVMRRMPDDRRLSELVRRGDDVAVHLDALARLLADFHAAAERGPAMDRAAGVDALAGRWSTNTEEMRPFGGRVLDAEVVDEVDELAARYLAGRRPLIERRVAAGRACDGHGDLLADDVFCPDDGPRVLDCLEFDDALRYEDVLADVAFLAMDLERMGRADLAEHFLAAYRQTSGDDWPSSLAHHHIAYRAQVRAKVAAIRADQGDAESAGAAGALLGLALAHLERGAVRMILVGGAPGTGKSTLAAGLADALGAVLVRSDVVRKELAGLEASESGAAAFGQGIYDPASKDITYRTVIARAEELVGLGETVVLDASWTAAAHRDQARQVASNTSTDVVEVRCVLDPDVAAKRIAVRARRGGDASDADESIARALAAGADPWAEATNIDTSAAPAQVLEAALATIQRSAAPGRIVSARRFRPPGPVR